MGPQDGVDVVLAAADLIVHTLGRTDISFTLMGGGDCYADLVAERDRLGLQDYVELPGRVPDATSPTCCPPPTSACPPTRKTRSTTCPP